MDSVFLEVFLAAGSLSADLRGVGRRGERGAGERGARERRDAELERIVDGVESLISSIDTCRQKYYVYIYCCYSSTLRPACA